MIMTIITTISMIIAVILITIKITVINNYEEINKSNWWR